MRSLDFAAKNIQLFDFGSRNFLQMDLRVALRQSSKLLLSYEMRRSDMIPVPMSSWYARCYYYVSYYSLSTWEWIFEAS